jgi:eukaryotic-like serine/threonine-protein kinase
MAVRAEPSRDLRLGLQALESGAIDREQLIAALKAWARSKDRTLAEILAASGVVDGPTLARLEDRVTRDLDLLGISPGLPRAAEAPVTPDPTASFAFASPALGGETADSVRATSDGVATGIGGRRFQVLRPHARGGLGEVFIAFDRELNRSVALKELQARLAHDPAAQSRFLLEAEITGRLEHPGIVPVYSLGRYADGRPYYAMHLIQGETLRDAIDRFHHLGGAAHGSEGRELAFRRLLRSVIDACNAVAYAHSRGVVHRDLKPENIMLGRFGETLVVDWGVAKVLLGPEGEGAAAPSPDQPPPDASITQPGSVIGTPRYMSPEQAKGDLDGIGLASDIYSLGAILYCVLVGHGPFPDGDMPSVLHNVRLGIFPAPRRMRRSIDPALEAICLKAMALKPTDRYTTALDLGNELEAWLADVRYRGEQGLALSQVKGSLARLCLERAHNCFGRETTEEGMLWLARALENAPSDPPDLERVIRTSLSGWHAGAKLLERCFRHGGEIHAVAFCPEGRRLATAGEDGATRLWDISTGSTLSAPLKHNGPVRAVVFSPDGKLVVTAGDDRTIRRWDALTGEPVGKPIHNDSPVALLLFSPDGSRIAAASSPEEPFLWDTATGMPAHKAHAHNTRVLAVAFAPDGSTIAVACDDGAVCLLDPATGRPLGEPFSHGSAVCALAFDPSGRTLLTGSLDGNTQLWDITRQVTLVTLAGQGAIRSLAFRPGGDAFAVVCEDGTARLWESATGRPIGEPLNQRSRVDCLAFRPDGTMVATGSLDGMVRLWCAASGLPIGPPLAHGGTVRTLVFSNDGRRLATGGSDVVARCWKAPNPVEGHAERVSCWVSVTTDLAFDAGDAIQRMDSLTSWDLRRRLTELGGAPLR